MPQLDVATYSSQIFWLLICLSIIYFSLKYLFIPRLESSIEARRKRVEKLLVEAEKMQLESNLLNMRYQEEIKALHLEALQIHRKALKEFEEASAKKLEKLNKDQMKKLEFFRIDLDETHKQCSKEIEKESEKLLGEFINKINDHSVEPKSKTIKRKKNG